MINFLLKNLGILPNPILPVSSMFLVNRHEYYRKIQAYHDGYVWDWVDYCLDQFAAASLQVCRIANDVSKIYMEDRIKLSEMDEFDYDELIRVYSYLVLNPVIVTVSRFAYLNKISLYKARKIIKAFLRNVSVLDVGKTRTRRYYYKDL